MPELLSEHYCYNCEHRNTCELVDNVCFCIDCAQYDYCTIKDVYCEAGHQIECNNDFTPKSEVDEDEYQCLGFR